MIQHILILACLILTAIPQGAYGSGAEKTEDKVHKAIKAEARSQAMADDWNLAKENLVNEIRELQTRLAWLEFQNKKHERYIERLKNSISDLEARKVEAGKLKENLDPFLEEVVARLEGFVANDLPFLEKERRQRLKFLHTTLNDFHLDLGEKLRRILEALSVEAGYGKKVWVSQQTKDVNGEKIRVMVLNLGRTAMYCQALDQSKQWIWDPGPKKWIALPKHLSRTIKKAMDTAQKDKSLALMELPLEPEKQ